MLGNCCLEMEDYFVEMMKNKVSPKYRGMGGRRGVLILNSLLDLSYIKRQPMSTTVPADWNGFSKIEFMCTQVNLLGPLCGYPLLYSILS